jgi:hypothetical protein
MLIEYRIKFENDGVTITQRVEPDSTGSVPMKPALRGGVTIAGSLGSSFDGDAGGEGLESTDSGSGGPRGGGSGTVPVIVLGPIVMCGSSPTETVLVAPPAADKAADEKGAKDGSARKSTATHGNS